MNLVTGFQCRQERLRLGLSLRSLSELVNYPGASAPQISGYECGSRISEDARRRIEQILEGVGNMKRAFPFSLDMKDATSLRAALAAYERRDERWFAERNVPPELPSYISY